LVSLPWHPSVIPPFYAVEQLWTEENMSKAVKAFR
jgi:hypothetical protein